ncbi:MAG: 4Fe-4S dicluster domain-containing protein [Nitrospinae bacterium]|nr:4Fe-4S dicluster domain-containing protein [Nitrospinota bacterium]
MTSRQPTLKLKSQQLNTLINVIKQRGYTPVGPVVREGSLIYDRLNSADELPRGWTDEQDAATFRLKRRSDNAYFGYNVGQHSWKQFLFLPKVKLFTSIKKGKTFEVIPNSPHEIVQNYAFIGVRPCDLQAIKVQDLVFNNGQFTDPLYKTIRKKNFIAVVNCTQAGGTCFCVSMSSGPRAYRGFDLAMTEVLSGDDHFFTVEVGSKSGAEVMSEIPHDIADQTQIETADKLVERAARQMGRSMDVKDIKEILYANLENKSWDDVANRCLTCANCVMVCPTCFCSTVEDITDVTGEHAERWRRWDSCFTMDFAKVFGGNFRPSSKGRYRQWMTHKLATWIDQFGTSGCVGCGRCITWCPVRIDITEEMRTIRSGAR